MRVGITGTRDGMTKEQKQSFCILVAWLEISQWHHGDCLGVDDQTTSIIAETYPNVHIVCHPPVDEALRAFNPHYYAMKEAKTHFARNRDIVDSTELLIVVPKDTTWQKYGGTWYTYDYAKKRKKRAIIIWPKGRVEEEKIIKVEDIQFTEDLYASKFLPEKVEEKKKELEKDGQKDNIYITHDYDLYGNRYVAYAARELGWKEIKANVVILLP
jgi:hypothetical protein